MTTPTSLNQEIGGIAISAASYWAPHHLLYSAWLEHGPFAFWLVDAAKPRSLVELGTHNGYSFFAFCQAVQSLKLQCSCYAIDTWEGDEHAGFYGDEVYQGVASIQQLNYADISTLIRATFDAALPYFSDGSIDLLHIDGRHTYEDALTDYTTWTPKLSERAIVVFHDTNVRRSDFGVWRLWSELKIKFPSFEFIHGNGLGVLAVGNEVPARLRSLFDAANTPEELSIVRAAYSRLGQACSRDYFAGAQFTAAVAVSKKLDEAQRVVESQSGQMAALELAKSESDSALAICQERLAAIEAKFTESMESNAAKSNRIVFEQAAQLQAHEEVLIVQRAAERGVSAELSACKDKLIICETMLARVTESNFEIQSQLVAQRIATELHARGKFLLAKQQESTLLDRRLEHPMARGVSAWAKAHPRRARWVWSGLIGARLLVTLQLGRLMRAMATRIRSG